MEKSLEEKLMDLKMRKKGSSVPTPCLAPSGAGDTAQRLVSLPLAGSRIQAGRAEQGAFLLVSKWLKIQGIPLHLLPALSWDQSPPGEGSVGSYVSLANATCVGQATASSRRPVTGSFGAFLGRRKSFPTAQEF